MTQQYILYIHVFGKLKTDFSCFKQYVYVYLQRQEDNLSTILLNRHYKAMPEAKKGKLNIKIMNKINKITILSDDLLSETLGGLSNRTEFSFLSII